MKLMGALVCTCSTNLLPGSKPTPASPCPRPAPQRPRSARAAQSNTPEAILETHTMSSHCPWFAPRCSNLRLAKFLVHCANGIGSPNRKPVSNDVPHPKHLRAHAHAPRKRPAPLRPACASSEGGVRWARCPRRGARSGRRPVADVCDPVEHGFGLLLPPRHEARRDFRGEDKDPVLAQQPPGALQDLRPRAPRGVSRGGGRRACGAGLSWRREAFSAPLLRMSSL